MTWLVILARRAHRKMKLLATELLHPPTGDHAELDRLREDVRRLREERDRLEDALEQELGVPDYSGKHIQVDLIEPSEVPCCPTGDVHGRIECGALDAWLKERGS